MAPLVEGRAQTWNDEATLRAVQVAVDRRSQAQSDDSLVDFRARAHGFVFFLAQFGAGLTDPPQLVRTDQLESEVYWKAPNLSKQRIIGWRDRRDLPTNIRYHRDHLGIVTNNFGDLIRLGQGDEVTGVPHPLSRRGPDLYEFALVDSLEIGLPQRRVRVMEVKVRPRDLKAPRVLGSLFLDLEQGDVVRFEFSFTKSAYLDDTIEDITLSLENGLWNGRYWLPSRQQIEIRRRASWFDFPARGIIRGEWEIDSYRFNTGIPDRIFSGPEISAAGKAQRDSFPWAGELEDQLAARTAPAQPVELEEVRQELGRITSGEVLGGLPRMQVGAGSISRVLHFNRVEGLAPGFGWTLRPAGWEVRLWGSYGLSDDRVKGILELSRAAPLGKLRIYLGREIKDVSDRPVISGLLNTVLAQEWGNDFGDYYLRDRVMVGWERSLPRLRLAGRVGYDRIGSVTREATPARNSFRDNPPLGEGDWGITQIEVTWRRAEAGAVREHLTLLLESGLEGDGSAGYGRVAGTLKVGRRYGWGAGELTAEGGWGSDDLPAHRSFVWGGRGTAVGEPFRAWGGRRFLALGAGLTFEVPVPEVPVGSFATTGAVLSVGPWIKVGWTGGLVPTVPWVPTGEARVVTGISLGWLHDLIRAEIGYGLSDSELRFSADVGELLWPIL